MVDSIAATGRDALDRELERFRASMRWSPDAAEYEKDLVLGNLNSFIGHLRRTGFVPEEDWRRDLEKLQELKDEAYAERNRLVAWLARCFPSGTARTEIEGRDPEWHGCVYIDLPTGQVSWHYHDREAGLFLGLPAYRGQWDGHTTEQKYERLAALWDGYTAHKLKSGRRCADGSIAADGSCPSCGAINGEACRDPGRPVPKHGSGP